VNISLTLDPNSDAVALKNATLELKEIGEVEVRAEQTMISVIGRGVRQSAGLAARVFGEIKDIPVHMISMGASEMNLSFVVHADHTAEAVRRLHTVLLSQK
jgi:aspartate kinase